MWCNEYYGRRIEKNAADIYAQAWVCQRRGQIEPQEYAAGKPSDWTPETVAALTAWFDENDRRYALFAEAARITRCYFRLEPYRIDLGDELVFEFEQCQQSGLLGAVQTDVGGLLGDGNRLIIRAKLHFLSGQYEQGLADLKTVLRATNHLCSQPTTVAYMYGLTLSRNAHQAMIQLPVYVDDHEALSELLKELRVVDRMPPKPIRQLRHTRLEAWDGLQRFLADRNGDGSFDHYVNIDPAAPLELREPRSLEDAVKTVEDEYLKWKRICSVVDYDKARRLARSLHGGAFARWYDVHASGDRAALIKSAGPGVELFKLHWSLRLIHWRTCGLRNGAHLVLHLHAFRATNGRWPQDLGEATKATSPGVRRDPFSSGDLVYRLDRGQPVLYSVGVDGKDDGGKRAERAGIDADGDWFFWPPVGE